MTQPMASSFPLRVTVFLWLFLYRTFPTAVTLSERSESNGYNIWRPSLGKWVICTDPPSKTVVEFNKSDFAILVFFGTMHKVQRNQRFRLWIQRYKTLPTTVTLSERSESNGSNLWRAILANKIISKIIINLYKYLLHNQTLYFFLQLFFYEGAWQSCSTNQPSRLWNLDFRYGLRMLWQCCYTASPEGRKSSVEVNGSW